DEGGRAPLPAPRYEEERDSPALEVLRHVVHAWEGVEPWVRYPEVFPQELHARTFLTLMAHPTVPEAIAAADPDVAELITRLATEETQAEPFDAVVRLLTEVARRQLAERRAALAADPDDLEQLRIMQWLTTIVDHLRDPATADGAADQL